MDLTADRRSVSGCRLVADAVRQFGEVRLKVTGTSMIPTVWPGDVICVCRQAAGLRPGSIVLFQQDEGLVAHRAIRQTGASIITRGDSLFDEDRPIAESEIVGEVVSLVRNGRYIQLRHTRLKRAISFVLRRSDFCRCMTIRVGLRFGRWGAKELICGD